MDRLGVCQRGQQDHGERCCLFYYSIVPRLWCGIHFQLGPSTKFCFVLVSLTVGSVFYYTLFHYILQPGAIDIDLTKQPSGKCFNEHEATFNKFNTSVFLEYLAYICNVNFKFQTCHWSDQLLESVSRTCCFPNTLCSFLGVPLDGKNLAHDVLLLGQDDQVSYQVTSLFLLANSKEFKLMFSNTMALTVLTRLSAHHRYHCVAFSSKHSLILLSFTHREDVALTFTHTTKLCYFLLIFLVLGSRHLDSISLS